MTTRLAAAALVGLLAALLPSGAVAPAVAAPDSPNAGDPITFSDVRVSTTSFYPARDGYKDDLLVELTVDSDMAGMRFEYLDAQGSVVRSTEKLGGSGSYDDGWSGRDESRDPVPEGSYDVEAVAWDDLGNTVRERLATVTLSWRRLVPVDRTYVVSAQGSRVDTWTPGCARVVRGPGSWNRGLGYRVGSCQGDAYAFTYHQLDRRPRGWLRGTVSAGGYGREVPRPGGLGSPDWAVLNMNRTRAEVRLGHRERWNDTYPRPYRALLDDEGDLGWRVAAAGWTRYDVKAFRVRFVGQALR